MVAWKRGDSMRFERNESYWGKPPLFKKLRFQVIPEAGARIAALRAGQVASSRRCRRSTPACSPANPASRW